jgi:hypothetical protein
MSDLRVPRATPEQLARFESCPVLFVGGHGGSDSEHCARELLQFVATGHHADRLPPCVTPTAGCLPTINDSMGSALATELLRPRLLEFLGTFNDGKDQQRAFRCADFACRVAAPHALRSAGLESQALALEALEPVVDRATALRAARAAADAAARAAARAAADAAARAAAARAAAAAAARAARAAAARAAAARAAAAANAAAWRLLGPQLLAALLLDEPQARTEVRP